MTDDELERFCADAYPKLVGALAHHFGDRWLAEELAQEALVRVCDHWDRVRKLSSRSAGPSASAPTWAAHGCDGELLNGAHVTGTDPTGPSIATRTPPTGWPYSTPSHSSPLPSEKLSSCGTSSS